MTCSLIAEHRAEFVVESVCTTLREAGVQIAPSTYYARQQCEPSARARRDEVLKWEIAQVHHDSLRVFGARKMHIVLNREHDRLGRRHVARCTVERLMRDLGLHGIRRKKVPNTMRSAPREQCPADLVDRHFSAFTPNQLWVSDFTYLMTTSGWVYVAFIVDVYSQRIVAWHAPDSQGRGTGADPAAPGVVGAQMR